MPGWPLAKASWLLQPAPFPPQIPDPATLHVSRKRIRAPSNTLTAVIVALGIIGACRAVACAGKIRRAESVNSGVRRASTGGVVRNIFVTKKMPSQYHVLIYFQRVSEEVTYSCMLSRQWSRRFQTLRGKHEHWR